MKSRITFNKILNLLVRYIPRLLFILCALPPLSCAEPIKIASKKFTESVILGEILSEYLRLNQYETQHIRELGGTRLVWNALIAGEIDLYVEYSGTLKEEILQISASEFELLAQEAKKYHVTMLPALGFNNTYAMGMKTPLAQKLNIKTISDLKSKKLSAGFSNEFLERKDGWPGLKKLYQLDSISARGIDHSIAYKALNESQLDIVDLYSTDPEIAQYNLTVLLDEKKFFPQYNAHIVVRSSLLEQHSSLYALLLELSGTINENQMMALNSKVTLQKQSEQSTAQEYLGVKTKSSNRQIINPILKFTANHLMLVLLSIVPAIIIAIPLGLLAFYFPRSGAWTSGAISIIQTIPALALLVFLIRPLTFIGLPGIGNTPAITALFLYGLFPIFRNTLTGLESIPTSLKNVSEVMGLTGWRKIYLFDLPLSMPSILSGIRTALVLNIGFATLGALVGAGGLGQPILTGIRLDDYELILSGAVPAALLALITQFLFTYMERHLIPRGLRL